MKTRQTNETANRAELTTRIPHNPEAEISLLGSILLDNDTLNIAADRIVADDFYDAVNKEIFTAMLKLHDDGKPIDLATLYMHMANVKLLEEKGGIHYLTTLNQNLPSATNVQRYAELIKETSLLRKAIAISQEALTLAQLPMEDVSAFLDKFNQDTFALTLQNTAKPYFSIQDVMQSTFAKLEELYCNQDQMPGVSSGFIDFDRKTAGFKPGTLTIVAARPAMGKTALALNFLTNAAIDRQVPAAFFSLEMTKEELGNRIISSRAKIKGDNMRRGTLSEAEWNRVMTTM